MTGYDAAVTPPPPLATTLKRLGGFAVDSVFYAVILLAVLAGGGLSLQDVATGVETIPNSVLLVDLLLVGVYQVSLTAWRGQTLGKMIVHTKVVDSDSGEVPTLQNAFIRWGAPAALSTVPWLGYLALLMYAWILWDPRRQGLHDKAAHTVVIAVQ